MSFSCAWTTEFRVAFYDYLHSLDEDAQRAEDEEK